MDHLTELPATTPSGVLAAAREMVGSLGDVLWAAVSPDELLDASVELERLRSSLAAVQARVAVEIEATEAAKKTGWVSPGDYLTAVAGGRHGHGGRLLRTARSLCAERSATLDALQAGKVSPEQAEVVTQAVGKLPQDPELRDRAEAALLAEADRLPASDLAKAGRHLLEVLDPDGVARAEERALDRMERSAHTGRFLSIVGDGLGGVRVSGRGSAEDAEIIKTTLHALAAPQPAAVGAPDCDGEGAGRDPRDHGARCWDALVDACLRLQSAEGLLPDDHGARPRMTVTVGLETLVEGIGTATLGTGEQLSATAVRRLACDAEVIPAVLGSRGEVLDVGRAQRLVTAAIWKALVLRDEHCRFPGCRRLPIACDAHHLVPWSEGGATSLDNLVLLCRAHHTLLHTTPWQVRLDPVDRRPVFRPPDARAPDGTTSGRWIRDPRSRDPAPA
jgi:hypothetical protein